jgi:hypothetical protein
MRLFTTDTVARVPRVEDSSGASILPPAAE